MRASFVGAVARLAAAAALAGCAAAPATEVSRSWLDAPLAGWNRAGAPLPLAPMPEGEPPGAGRCREALRAAASVEDRAVAAAGWTLYGPVERRDGAVVALGMTSVDGMCRPLGFQAFMFAGERFAGTLSPVPMNSRADGAVIRVEITGPAGVAAEFARYTASDPLCCPSRVSRVTYRIEGAPAGASPVLVPVQVATSPKH